MKILTSMQQKSTVEIKTVSQSFPWSFFSMNERKLLFPPQALLYCEIKTIITEAARSDQRLTVGAVVVRLLEDSTGHPNCPLEEALGF